MNKFFGLALSNSKFLLTFYKLVETRIWEVMEELLTLFTFYGKQLRKIKLNIVFSKIIFRNGNEIGFLKPTLSHL